MSPPPPIAAADADAYAPAASLPVARPAARDGTLLAILFIVLSTVFFSLADVIAKAMMASIDPLQVTWFRFAVFFAAIPPAVLAIRGIRGFATRRPRMHLARGLAMAGGSTLFILGLGYLPAAENTAIAFLGPLFITALSIPILGEKVGFRRWAAALVGFLGVMIVVRPGTDAFHVAALLPMGAALIGAFGSIFTRQMADEPPETTLAWSGIVGFLMITAVVPFIWTTPSWEIVLLGFATGALSTLGHAFVVLAFQRAGASTLAPFTYVQLLFAGLLSTLILGDYPSGWTYLGGAVIAASGLYTAHRERVRARERRLGIAA
jgi:drug/metabolite transporter (DMT)-like permease